MKKLLSIMTVLALVVGVAASVISPMEVFAEEETERDLSKAELTLEKGPYYCGKKPAVTVMLDGKTLELNIDYTVEYINYDYVGTATVKVTGTGNEEEGYYGTKSKDYENENWFKEGHYYCASSDKEEITSMNQCKWVDDQRRGEHNLQCTKENHEGCVIMYCTSANNIGGGGFDACSHELPRFENRYNPEWAEGCPFDSCKPYKEAAAAGKLLCVYTDGENKGEHFVEPENCTWREETYTEGEQSATFHFLECNEHKVVNPIMVLMNDGMFAYSSGAKRWIPRTHALEDYGAFYPDCIDCTFCTEVTLEQNSYIYDGTAKTPAVTVKYREQELVQGTDYNVTYTNNTNAGTAKVNIIGIGRMEDGDFVGYSGTNSVSFTIESVDPVDPISIETATATLTKTALTYNGKAQTPAATVKLNGVALAKGTDYTVTYKNNKNVGLATATIKGTGNYTGTITRTFKINPKGTTIKAPARLTRGFTAKWAQQSAKMAATRITGYQIRYSLKSSMANAKLKKVKGYAKTSVKVTKLKAKKKYYVQVRTYKTVNGKTYYSAWSGKRAVTTK